MQAYKFAAMTAATAIAVITQAPAAQADDATMPDVTGGTLQTAVAEIAGVTTAKVEPSNVSGPTQVIYNYTNWIVCSETPAAGDDITPGTEIEVDVRRPATECPE